MITSLTLSSLWYGYATCRGSMSGLPVHINGFFAVSSNRHQLKWPSIKHADDAGESTVTDKACLWNELLLEEVREISVFCLGWRWVCVFALPYFIWDGTFFLICLWLDFGHPLPCSLVG